MMESETACGRTVGVHVAVWVAVATLSGSFTQAQQPWVDAPRPHAVGQSVTPSFEGWYPNPNGTFSLVFGYLNRNYEERLDIAVGPNNKMEPGPEGSRAADTFPAEAADWSLRCCRACRFWRAGAGLVPDSLR